MPLYEYRCKQCGFRYEKIQKFNAEPEEVCPKCGGELERPLTAPALQFKGAGWYVNDYAPKAAASSTEKPDASDTGSDSKPSTESKPATESKSAESAPKPASTPSSSSTTSST